MFTKRVTVKRGDKTYVYVKLVESYRDGGRVRQRVIANLGREDDLKTSGLECPEESGQRVLL